MAATGRWAILRRALLAKNATEQADVADTASTVSVRRFASFGLFHIDAIDCATVSNRFQVQQYSRKDHRILVCSLLETRQSHEALLGFNNTGNVCIWPAEEVLAKYSLDHLELFRYTTDKLRYGRTCSPLRARGKRVLELGSGMTAFAGILVALYGGATSVALTDGNETSVEDKAHNKEGFIILISFFLLFFLFPLVSRTYQSEHCCEPREIHDECLPGDVPSTALVLGPAIGCALTHG